MKPPTPVGREHPPVLGAVLRGLDTGIDDVIDCVLQRVMERLAEFTVPAPRIARSSPCHHGRSTAAGVASGQNFHGCCACPMQIHNGFGAGTATWGAYAVDGNGDGRRDIYDIADAAPTAARHLRASGARGDGRRAIFAYNHDQSYVARVLQLAAR